MRDPSSLNRLKATFPLGPPPDLVRLGLYNPEFRYAAPSLTDPVRDAFLDLRDTFPFERGPMSNPEDRWYLDTYEVSFDAEGRLHSLGDQPATYTYDHHPSRGSLSAMYYIHGEPGRADDLPYHVSLVLEPSEELYSMSWSGPSRPNEAPIAIFQNGEGEYGFSWAPGRLDAPTAIYSYSREWSLPADPRQPKWVYPQPVVYDIAYMAAEPLSDADARFLMQQFDSVDPEPDERALLARTLLRWQRALSQDTTGWLRGLA